ncbi:hypothetical protein MC885_004722 [Smutsia gigantea]|nr:hypothetical protein MC885_004722 [Smutsia gigantea]
MDLQGLLPPLPQNSPISGLPPHGIWVMTAVLIHAFTDGLNALLGKDMMSDLTQNDLDTLLSMEIKLRLLDLENIQIPDAPPPIPKEPSNYDFVYDCN